MGTCPICGEEIEHVGLSVSFPDLRGRVHRYHESCVYGLGQRLVALLGDFLLGAPQEEEEE